MTSEPIITREGGVLRINGFTYEEWKAQKRKIYRGWLKEDLLKMKEHLQGMRWIGATDELVEEYKWLAAQVRSDKRLISYCK